MAIYIDAIQAYSASAQIYLHGTIGVDIRSEDFAKEIQQLKQSHREINIFISSDGGSLIDTIAIYETIRDCGMITKCIVHGICDTQAYIIFLAGRKQAMKKTALISVSELSAPATFGHSEDLRQTADLITALQNAIADDLAKSKNKSFDQIQKIYFPKDRKLYSAEEAKSAGVVEEIITFDPSRAMSQNTFNAISSALPFSQFDLKAEALWQDSAFNVIDEQKAKQMIFDAVKNNKISQLEGEQLYNSFKGKMLYELYEAIKNISAERVKNLMRMGWGELDKENLLTELKSKYLYGFEIKFFEAFGVHVTNSKKAKYAKSEKEEADNLLQFVIETGSLDKSLADNVKTTHENEDTVDGLKAHLMTYAEARIIEMMSKSWDELNRLGMSNELKTKYFQGWKQKYFEEFKIEYKEK